MPIMLSRGVEEEMKWCEMQIFFPTEKDMYTYAPILRDIIYSSKNAHFFFEPNHEIRLRATGKDIKKIKRLEPEVKKLGCKVQYVPYKGEAEFYGKNAWKGMYKFFHRNTLTAMDYNLGNYEYSKNFYASRYIHLTCNAIGYSIEQEAKLYLRMGFRYTIISLLFKILRDESKVRKALKIFGWLKVK